MSDDFLTSEVIQNLPGWFVPAFQQNARLCLPYILSMRDADDIVRATSPGMLTVYVEATGVSPVKRYSGSADEFLAIVNYLVFQNVPSEVVISFMNGNSWMYYDGDQRFSCLVGPKELIKRAFYNDMDVIKLYYIERQDDIMLDEDMKSRLFDAVTTGF